jgi:hypothetical protein
VERRIGIGLTRMIDNMVPCENSLGDNSLGDSLTPLPAQTKLNLGN